MFYCSCQSGKWEYGTPRQNVSLFYLYTNTDGQSHLWTEFVDWKTSEELKVIAVIDVDLTWTAECHKELVVEWSDCTNWRFDHLHSSHLHHAVTCTTTSTASTVINLKAFTGGRTDHCSIKHWRMKTTDETFCDTAASIGPCGRMSIEQPYIPYCPS